jgi:hypothetical protein
MARIPADWPLLIRYPAIGPDLAEGPNVEDLVASGRVGMGAGINIAVTMLQPRLPKSESLM